MSTSDENVLNAVSLQQLTDGKKKYVAPSVNQSDLSTGRVWKKTGDDYTFRDRNDTVDQVKQLPTDDEVCKHMGVKSEKCNMFMTQCLLSTEPNAVNRCIEALDDAGHDTLILWREQIKEMHPLESIALLARLGFCIGNDGKVISPHVWLVLVVREKWTGVGENLKTKGSPEEQIRKNPGLMTFLIMLVAFVNNNPSILEQCTLEKKSVPQHLLPSQELAHLSSTMLPQYKLPSTPNMIAQNLVNETKRLEHMAQTVGQNNMMPSYRGPIGIQEVRQLMNALPNNRFAVVPNMLVSPNVIFGGSNETLYNQNGGKFETNANVTNFLELKGKSLAGSLPLVTLVYNMIGALKSQNKVLKTEDMLRIEKKMETLQQAENEIVEFLISVDKYRAALDKNDYDPQEVSQEDMKNKVTDLTNLYNLYNSRNKTENWLVRTVCNLGRNLHVITLP